MTTGDPRPQIAALTERAALEHALAGFGAVSIARDLEALIHATVVGTDIVLVDGERAGSDLTKLIDVLVRVAAGSPVIVFQPKSACPPSAVAIEDLTILHLIVGRLAELRRRERAALHGQHLLTERVRALESWAESSVKVFDELLHELRTPVAVVQGYGANLLDGLDGPLQDAQRATTERIKLSAELMIDLLARAKQNIAPPPKRVSVAELPLTKRVASGRARVSLESICDEVVALFQRDASAQQLSLDARSDRALPPVWGHRTRLVQLLVNLVGNAIRFTPRGGRVLVRADLDEEARQCIIAVSDTGPGIPKSAWSKIFERGFSSQGRSGIGLSVAKDVAEEHGAELTVESEPNRGTTFSFTMPIDLRERTGAVKVLLVDDRILAGQLLIELKNRHKHLLPVQRPKNMETLAAQIIEGGATVVFAGEVEERLGQNTLDLPSLSLDLGGDL